MKKIIITAFVLIMALSFTACGEKANSNKDSSISYGSNNQSGSGSSGMGSDIKSDISSGMSEVESFTESAMDKLDGNSSNTDSSGNSKNESGTNSTSSINSSSKAKLNENYIKEKVLKHAGVAEKDLKYFDVDVDYENGRMIYDVDFVSGDTEYSYEIDGNTGDIIEHEKEFND